MGSFPQEVSCLLHRYDSEPQEGQLAGPRGDVSETEPAPACETWKRESLSPWSDVGTVRSGVGEGGHHSDVREAPLRASPSLHAIPQTCSKKKIWFSGLPS